MAMPICSVLNVHLIIYVVIPKYELYDAKVILALIKVLLFVRAQTQFKFPFFSSDNPLIEFNGIILLQNFYFLILTSLYLISV